MFHHFSLCQLAIFHYASWQFFIVPVGGFNKSFPESRKMTFVSVQKKTLSLAVSPVWVRCRFAPKNGTTPALQRVLP